MITIFAVTVFIAGILFVREEILSAGAKEELEEQKREAEICRRERLGKRVENVFCPFCRRRGQKTGVTCREGNFRKGGGTVNTHKKLQKRAKNEYFL